MDLVLLLDSSYSISVEEGEWGQLLSFTRDILTFLNIGESTHVGIVQFSNYTHREIGLTGDAQAALNALDNMVKINSYTALGEGLEEAERVLQDGGRANVTKFILVIGDGEVRTQQNLYFFGQSFNVCCRTIWVSSLLAWLID